MSDSLIELDKSVASSMQPASLSQLCVWAGFRIPKLVLD